MENNMKRICYNIKTIWRKYINLKNNSNKKVIIKYQNNKKTYFYQNNHWIATWKSQ